MTVQTDHLALSWSTSRGQDTYGYNICRLDVRSTGRRLKCMGGGYDMVGTVVGEWLQAAYQVRLVELANNSHNNSGVPLSRGGRYIRIAEFYGMTYDRDGDSSQPCNVRLDGACGIESMQRIAAALGLSLSRTYVAKGRKRGQTTGYMVTDYGSAEAMSAASN